MIGGLAFSCSVPTQGRLGNLLRENKKYLDVESACRYDYVSEVERVAREFEGVSTS